jgi:hypothetical protein
MDLPSHWPAEDQYLISLLFRLDYLTPGDRECQETSPLRTALDIARETFPVPTAG